ncbi:MAG: hypothetical protein ACREDK_07370 [Thermoplasmata archaeon]
MDALKPARAVGSVNEASVATRPRHSHRSSGGKGCAVLALVATMAILASLPVPPAPIASPRPRSDALAHPGDTAPVALEIPEFASQPSSIYLGETAYFLSTVVGGTLPYAYAFHGLPPGCEGTGSANFACRPTSVGTYAVLLNVTDAANASASAHASLTVLMTSTLEVVLAFDLPNVTVGSTLSIHPEVLGAVGPIAYAYPSLPAGCSSRNTSTLLCTPTIPAHYTVSVTVQDALGRTATDARNLTVLPAPLSIRSFTANESAPAAGTPLGMTVHVDGAVGTVSYTYTGLPGGCTSSDTPDLVCSPWEAGHFLVRLTVHDGLDRVAHASLPLAISTERPPTISDFVIAPSPARPGAIVTFVVSASGGVGELTYTFEQLPPGCAGPSEPAFQCIVNTSGSYEVTVMVADVNGVASQASANLIVGAVAQTYAPNSPLNDLAGHWWMGAVTIVVATGALAIAVTLVRRRRRRRRYEGVSPDLP